MSTGPTAGSSRPARAGDLLLVTRDPAEASAVLEGLYAVNTLQLGRPAQDFRFRMAVNTAGPLVTSLAHYGMEVHAHAAPVDTFVSNLLVSGSMRITAGEHRGRVLRRGNLWRWDDRADLRMSLDDDSAFANVQLPFTVIEEAAARTDRGGATGVRFLTNGAVDAAAERYWAGLTRFALDQAAAPDGAASSPLLREQLVHTLAEAALTVFPNSTMTHDYEPGPGRVGPATLRRALAHLHAHAGEPLTVTDLAAAAGIGVRALQQAFVTHLGCSPTAHLRRVRLARAHAELRVGSPGAGDTVAGTAARWGFGHPGRFAAAYQEVYGVPPGTTLRS